MLNEILDLDIISREVRLLKEDENYVYPKLKRSRYDVRIPKKVTKEIAYLFGVICGDGRLGFSKRKLPEIYPRTSILIYNSSEQYIRILEKLLNNIFNIKPVIYKKKKKNCYVLQIYNKFIWLYFHYYLKIKNRKVNLKVPDEVKNKELFKYFLAGLFDTDGYFSEVYGIMLNGTHSSFLSEINKLCEEYYGIKMLGPYFNTLKKDNKEYYRVMITTRSLYNSKFKEIIPLINEKYGMGPPGFEPGTYSL